MSSISEVSLYYLCIILLGVINISFKIKQSKLLTAVSGLHFTFILFFGLGGLTYARVELPSDVRVTRDIIDEKLALIVPYLFFGYLIISLIEYQKNARLKNEKNIAVTNLNEILLKFKNLNLFNSVFFGLAFLGSLFSQLSMANSGIGTFIPVFNNFLFPITILIIYNFKSSDKFSFILLILLIALVGFNAFTSAWRSQLLFFAGSVLIGLNLRGKLNFYLVLSLAIVYFLFILPFQQIKKYNYVEYAKGPLETLAKTFDLSFSERIDIASLFIAERINYNREICFVVNGLETNNLEYRNGESYSELFLQLIPRFFWPEKPSYNYFSGYVLPRKVGLLGVEDESTSWGVNSFAEFSYNFSYNYLPIFIIIFYFVLNYFDVLVVKLKLLPEFAWLLQTTLFFLSMNLVSVIYSSTYFLWAFISIILISKLFNENTTLR